jgi:hypothetical protein
MQNLKAVHHILASSAETITKALSQHGFLYCRPAPLYLLLLAVLAAGLDQTRIARGNGVLRRIAAQVEIESNV